MKSSDASKGGDGNSLAPLLKTYEARLAKALEEIERLEKENQELRQLLGREKPVEYVPAPSQAVSFLNRHLPLPQ